MSLRFISNTDTSCQAPLIHLGISAPPSSPSVSFAGSSASRMSWWNALSLQTGLCPSGSVFDPEVVSRSLKGLQSPVYKRHQTHLRLAPRPSASRWYLPRPPHQHHLCTKRTPQSERSELNSWASPLICSLRPSHGSGQNAWSHL